MSCITEILKRKGDKEYLVSGRTAIEDGGIYKDYEFLITLTSMGHRCGYVAISKDHPIYNFNDYPDYKVHGGVTFFDQHELVERILGHACDDKWIGFDAMHSGDGKEYELVKKTWPSSREYKEICSMEEIDNMFPVIKYLPRSKEYMIDECKNLIDQLIRDKAA